MTFVTNVWFGLWS